MKIKNICKAKDNAHFRTYTHAPQNGVLLFGRLGGKQVCF